MDIRARDYNPAQTIERETLYGFESKIDVNIQDPKILLTTSTNGVFVYDLRNLNKRLFTFENHTSEVTKAKWSPYNSSIFASSSEDRRVVIMDTNRVELPKYSDDYLSTQTGLIVIKFFNLF